jgi:hypothetical protein
MSSCVKKAGCAKKTKMGIASHQYKMHGIRGKLYHASRWAPDAICRKSGTNFAHRAALPDHLVKGKGCLAHLQQGYPPMALDTAIEQASQDQLVKRAALNKGIGHRNVNRPAYKMSERQLEAFGWPF